MKKIVIILIQTFTVIINISSRDELQKKDLCKPSHSFLFDDRPRELKDLRSQASY